MDEIDSKIIMLLRENARMTVKEIAQRVALSSPAVSERIKRMEKSGIIEGYSVRVAPRLTKNDIRAIISIYVPPEGREELMRMLQSEEAVRECFQVTGTFSHMVLVQCSDIAALDTLLNSLQAMGQTNTQIILSSMNRAQKT